jgi:hypothetical protein
MLLNKPAVAHSRGKTKRKECKLRIIAAWALMGYRNKLKPFFQKTFYQSHRIHKMSQQQSSEFFQGFVSEISLELKKPGVDTPGLH